MMAARLLFDENLSARLLTFLQDAFPESSQIGVLGMQGASDQAVWERAAQDEFIIVSKDNDFRQMSFLRGAPPKVIWLHIGNAPTRKIADVIVEQAARINAFADDSDTALLVIEAA
jgi:predicted nuclease of predicted toxin-antitoxin system